MFRSYGLSTCWSWTTLPKSRQRSNIAREVEINQALQTCAHLFVPLWEMFAEEDAVFTTEGAFDHEHIRKSLGRLHRQWKRTRAALDPEFDPANYERRPRLVVKHLSSRHASDSTQSSSTGRTPTSGRSRRTTERSERMKPERSAKDARSKSGASGVRSRGRRRTESGED